MDSKASLIASFADDLRAKGKRPATIESYSRDALEFLNYLELIPIELDAVGAETLFAYQNYLAGFDKENSIRRKVIGTRQFFRFLSDRTGGQTESPLDHVPIPERHDQLPVQLSDENLRRLYQKLSQTSGIKAKRDLSILYLLGLEGIKATELIDLVWEDWLESRHPSSLRIRGYRSRTISLQAVSSQALSDYRRELVKLSKQTGKKFSRVFIAFKGRDAHTSLSQMTRHGLKFLLYELGELVGLTKLNTERLRHHAVEFQLSQGRSPEEIMAHLGLRRLGNIAKHQNQANRERQV